MERRSNERSGFALAVAVMAMVVVGAVVTGSFLAASQRDRIGRNTEADEAAFYAAERGIQDVLGTKRIAFYEGIAVGDTAVVRADVRVGDIGAAYTVVVRRVAERLFFLNATGEVVAGGRRAGGERRAGLIARTPYFRYPRDRAVQTRGTLTIGGRAGISGDDAVPHGWDDCPTGEPAAGVVAGDASGIEIRDGAAVTGHPPVREDPALASADVLDYGDTTFGKLAAIADRVYHAGEGPVTPGPATSGDGSCAAELETNWGDPGARGPCGSYFPIVYSKGDLTVRNGTGQGILLVDGDLAIAGDFEFAGIVIVKGALDVTGAGNRITGTINIVGAGGASTVGHPGEGEETLIQFSRCAIDRAFEASGKLSRAFALRERSWFDLSTAGVAGRAVRGE